MSKKRKIGNIDEIRKKVKKAKFKKEIRLSVCEVVTDVPKMIESHLVMLDVPVLYKRRHSLFYERLKMVLDTVGIEIKLEEVDE